MDTASRILLRCPIDRGDLRWEDSGARCLDCGTAFSLVRGVPVLLDKARSVIRAADFLDPAPYDGAGGYGGSLDGAAGMEMRYRNLVNGTKQATVLGHDLDPIAAVTSRVPSARFLVVGSRERTYKADTVYPDVALSPGIACVCDTYDLPFPDADFAAVIADSVLDVQSQDLMVQSSSRRGGMHYGSGSTREGHNDCGSPSSDTA